MPLFLKRCVVAYYCLLVLFQHAFGHRSSRAVAQEVLKPSNLEEVDGVNDYPRAKEFADSWLNEKNYRALLESAEQKVKDMRAGKDPSQQEVTRLIKDLWMLVVQKLADGASYGCFNLCLLCQPSPVELANDHLKTITVTRSKGFKDKLKMALVGPADAAGGLVAGVIAGLAAAGASGASVGVATGTKVYEAAGVEAGGLHVVAGGFLGLMAGIVSGAVTSGVVLAFSELVLPLLGVVKGIGLTNAFTNCGRVGFETAEKGELLKEQPFHSQRYSTGYGLKLLREAMHYNKSWLPDHNFLSSPEDAFQADKSPTREVQDYKAMSHCEYLRLKPFDTRHAILCARHSLLCGKRGGLLLPTQKDDQCALASGALGSHPDLGLSDLFKVSKERVECIELLCSYGGYKKGALQLHPDRLIGRPDLTAEEKSEKTEQFKKMVNCKDKYDLMLDSAEERDEACN